MLTLLVATRNAHKVAEIRAILGGQFQYLTLNDLPNPPEVVEDADSFAGNAAKKSRELAAWLGAVRLPAPALSAAPVFALADDSGLEVDALGGAPGVHSARFAALDTGAPANSSSADNNAKLIRLLRDVPEAKRTARFRCVLALTPATTRAAEPLAPTELFAGACEGRMVIEPRGAAGFGYDPLFIPTGHQQTFAELGEDVKNHLSHRARALAKLKRWLLS
jgi:XTP/dITP diphosphohydrolase